MQILQTEALTYVLVTTDEGTYIRWSDGRWSAVITDMTVETDSMETAQLEVLYKEAGNF